MLADDADAAACSANHPSAMSAPCVRRYDVGMTKAKIAISLPKDQIARVRREVRAGRAPSVSGYIATVLAEQERCESLRELLRDLILQHGAPAAKDIKWAERALQQRRI
jgi:Arc/MetJ-type ribon-helix-helix transcriptional regulator